MIAGPPNQQIDITCVLDGTARPVQTYTLADSTAEEVEDVLSFDIMETAHTCQVIIEGTGPCRIRGLELQATPKPVTKYLSRR